MAITDQTSSLEERIQALEELKERIDKSNTLDEILVNTDKIQTLSRKVLKVPVIDDFTNATHDHSSTSGGDILRLSLTIYADNAAAITGGLVVGNLYRTGANPDVVCIVH